MARWRTRRHRCGQPLVVLGECRGLRLAAGGQPQQPAQVVGALGRVLADQGKVGGDEGPLLVGNFGRVRSSVRHARILPLRPHKVHNTL
jgi:hypothetical protein